MLDSDRLIAVYTLCGLIVLWVGWVKALRPKWRRFWASVKAAVDSLVGRDAIHEPITGRELAPALPGIGQRMATVEDAVKTIAQTVSNLAEMNGRVTNLENQVGKNTENLAVIMAATTERIVTKAEAAEMWRAIANKDVTDVTEEPPEVE